MVAKLGACFCFREPSLRVCAVGEYMLTCSCTLPSVLVYLAKAGAQVVVPFRDEDEKRHLKVMGDLGQIVPLVRRIPNPRGLRTRSIGVCSIVRVW